MGNPMKGMRAFHICSIGACKQSGMYQLRNGECICKRCLVKYIKRNGIKDFWPQYLIAVIEEYNSREGRNYLS